MMNRLLKFAGALALAAFAATQAAAADSVVVSSKIDTEGGVLGNIILQVLKANNIPVESKIQLGATPIVRQAITQGQIDIYPEYTGNAAFFFNKADLPVWNKADEGYAKAKELDYAANKIVWLTPAKANNTWAIAVRGDVADANKLATLTDFGAYVAKGGQVKLAASSEFVTSPSALPAFEKAYGFKMKPDQLITLSGGDTAATISAAAQQTSGANAAMVYGTDGGIAPSGLKVMEGRQGRAARLSAHAHHPRGKAEAISEDRRSPETDLRGARSPDAADPQRSRSGRRRACQCSGGRLPVLQGLRQVR